MSITSILAIAVLALLLFFMLRRYFKGSPFETVDAKVIEVEVSQRVDPKTKEEFTGYVGIYECVINGTTYTKRGALSRDANRYHVGDVRTLLYEKADPSMIHLVKMNPRNRKIGIILIGIGFLLVIAALLFTYL